MVTLLWVLFIAPAWGQEAAPSEGTESSFQFITVPTTSSLDLGHFRVNLRYNHQTIILSGQPEGGPYGEIELRGGVYPQGVALPTDLGLKFFISADSPSYLVSVVELKTKFLEPDLNRPALAVAFSSSFHVQELNFVLLSLIASGRGGEALRWSLGGQGGAAFERALILPIGIVLLGGSWYLWNPFLEAIAEYTGLLSWGSLSLGLRYNITPSLGVYVNSYANVILAEAKVNAPRLGGGLGWKF